MTAARRLTTPTIEDWLAAIEREEPVEFIDGALVEKAAPTGDHAESQFLIGGLIGAHFGSGRRGGGSGGWRFFTELDLLLGSDGLRPDLCGFRSGRLLSGRVPNPCTLVPDWACEILSPRTSSRDRGVKRVAYFKSGVGHDWLIDPIEGTLEVLRREANGYLIVATATRGEKLRAEPFEELELDLDELLGPDPNAPPAP